MAGRHRFEQD